ncbi:VOC family protein [Synechococcus sp. CC9311]|jgi:catechol-2,3-dioxygenase|uniref:VOC family protein n=1 Tax=Synechococcus sp. (strain CC9311) TaxID=64471 RepID=UPI0000DDA967|nr:VOC family protein [Synechococcus sp. CC9311]ABI47295.1 glyoxalase family protein family [Synechococcus sp. CC9311]
MGIRVWSGYVGRNVVASSVNSVLPLQPSFSHLGLYVKSLSVMERFYCDVLGFYVTDRLRNGDQEILFLSRSLLEHHQIVLAPGRSETSASTVNQVSFEIETLPKLIDAFQALTQLGITGMESLNHGGSWSLYVPDPEGNTIELFVRTDWYVPLHAMTGLDLNQPEEAIRQQTVRMVQQTPGSKTWEVWRQEFQKRMDQRG